jgi:hypothetical protein
MLSWVIDWTALIRALIIGMGANLVVTALGLLFFKKNKAIWAMLGCGLMLLVATILFYSWPSLVVVPDLSGLSQAEAEAALERQQLIPEARPVYSIEAKPGLVGAGSQEPGQGIKVRPGTLVRFGVAVSGQPPVTLSHEPIINKASVSLFQPKGGESVKCTRYPDGTYHFSALGTVSVLLPNQRLLLWARPVKPPSETPGWYLQRPPINGIHQINPDGSWEGTAQIGNAMWPPHTGDILDVAVTVVPENQVQQLFATPGVETRISLPGISSDIALGVRVDLR